MVCEECGQATELMFVGFRWRWPDDTYDRGQWTTSCAQCAPQAAVWMRQLARKYKAEGAATDTFITIEGVPGGELEYRA